MATGTGKTTVMAMLIAWQTINKVRRPRSQRFTKGFLVVTPGITIRDRLRVIQPNDPDSYYNDRELVPGDMRPDLLQAKIVITNYHAFKHRERMKLAKGSRALLQGRGPAPDTTESTGQMIRRVMPELMGMTRIMVLNDEAHHCYREKPGEDDEGPLKADDRKEAKENYGGGAALGLRPRIRAKETRHQPRDRPLRHAVLPARVGLRRGHALSVDDERLLAHGRDRMRDREAAPGAGGGQHPRGRHAPLPQSVGAHTPQDAEEGPREGRDSGPAESSAGPEVGAGCPLWTLPANVRSLGATQASACPLASSSSATTSSSSKLVYEYVSGFERPSENGSPVVENGRLPLFRNFDENGHRYRAPPHSPDRQPASSNPGTRWT